MQRAIDYTVEFQNQRPAKKSANILHHVAKGVTEKVNIISK